MLHRINALRAACWPSVALLVASLLGALTPDACARGLSVELAATAQVAEGAATLAQVARVSGDDPALVRELGRLPVLGTLRAGARQQISRAQIERLVEAHLPEARGVLEINGSERVMVSRAAVPLETDAVVELARNFLLRGFAAGFEGFSLSPVGRVSPLQVPPGYALANPRLAPGGVLAKRTCVWVDIVSASDGVYQSVPVWFMVKAERQVLVAGRDVPKGVDIGSAAVRTQSRDVLAVRGRPLDESVPPRDMVATRAIAPGEVLTDSIVESPHPVVRGQDLLVRMRIGEIILEYTVKAAVDARLGQKMRVTNPASRESFWVKIVGPGLAEAI